MSALANINDPDDEGQDTTEASDEQLVGYPPPPPEQRAEVAASPLAAGGTPPLVWAVSAHGGAGASVLASRLGFVADAGHVFPAGKAAGEARVVIVAEETLAGVEAAHRLVLQHLNGLAGDTDLLAVITRPSRPGWEGKKLPKPIRYRLGLLDDPQLGCTVIRIGWDNELAVTLPKDRASLSPPQVAEWLHLDAKKKAKARRVRGSLAALGLTDAAAELLTLASHPNSQSGKD